MKRIYYSILVPLAILALSASLTGCEATDDPQPAPIPVLTSVTVQENLTSQTTASIEVVGENIVELIYSYYLTGDSSDAFSNTVALEDGATTYTIELSELTANSEYTVEVVGEGSDNSQTATKSVTFSTLDVDQPAVTSAELDEASVTANSASISVTVADATQLFYTLAVSGESASDPVEVALSGNAATIELSELSDRTDYIATVYATNNGNTSSEVEVTFTTLAAYNPVVSATLDSESVTSEFASFSVTVEDADQLFYTLAVSGESASEPVEVALSDNAAVVELSGLAASTTYDVVFYATNQNGEYRSEDVTVSFETLNDSGESDTAFTVTNFTTSPTNASYELTLNEGCEGVIVYADQSEWFDINNITSLIEYQSATVYTESGVYSVFSYDMSPSVACKFVVVEVENVEITTNMWGGEAVSCSLVGELSDYEIYEFTTGVFDEDFVINNATDDVVEFLSTTSDFTQIAASVTRNGNENISSVHVGAVKTSELAGTTIGKWVVENNWFVSDWGVKSPNAFVDYYGSVYDPLDVTLWSLETGTDYTLFAVPVTTSGAFGTITTYEASTIENVVVVDENLKPSVTINTGLSTAEFVIDFKDCAKVYYEYGYATGYGSATDLVSAQEVIYSNVLSGYNVAYDYGSGTATISISWLTESTEYTFWCMGMDADGTYGPVCEYTYTTKSLSWDGATTASATQISGSVDEYGFADIKFNIDLSDDTVMATVAPVSSDYIVYDTPNAWGSYILSSTWYNQYLYADGELTFTFYDSSYKLVIVTEDKDGVYGTPVIVEVDWDALTE
ncbi:MAG: hypothetical protein R3Y61_02975 [Rikenellaceae bacterium]